MKLFVSSFSSGCAVKTLLLFVSLLAVGAAGVVIEEVPEAPAEYLEKTSVLENAVSPKLHADLAEAGLMIRAADATHRHLRSLLSEKVRKKMKAGGNDVASLSELATDGVAELHSVMLQARRVWEGHHKTFGADLAVFNWAQSARKVLARRFTDAKQTDYYQNELMLVRAELNALVALATQGKLRSSTKLFGGPQMRQRVVESVDVLRRELQQWENKMQEVVKSLEASLAIVNTLYPQKPAMSGSVQRNPTNAELWNSLAALRSEVFNKAYNEALQLVIAPSDVDQFAQTLAFLDEQPLTVARMERLSLLKGLEEVTSVRAAGKVLALADRYMAAAQAKPSEQVWSLALDELLAEMDYFIYVYDVTMPGSVLHRGEAALRALAQEEQYWAALAAHSPANAKMVKDATAAYRATLLLSQAKFTSVLVPLVAQARDNLATLIY